MVASQFCIIAAQQSSWASIPPSERQASAGAAVQRRIAISINNAPFLRRAMRVSSPNSIVPNSVLPGSDLDHENPKPRFSMGLLVLMG